MIGECISAMQKMIRRGEEEEALYWAIEVESLEPKYLINRLRIIATEDIGLADSDVVLLVNTLATNYVDCLARKNDATRLFLAHIILLLCRAPKSRITDDFLHVVYRDRTRREIPDVALDKHTAAGRKLGRGYEHFFGEGCRLRNEVDVPRASEYRDRCRASVLRGDPIKPAFKASAAGTSQPPTQEKLL